MKRLMSSLVGLSLLGAIWFTSAPVQAIPPSATVQTAPGPYYATPSWDQKLTAAKRFLILQDWNSEAVLDRETGLVWEQSPGNTQQLWGGARQQCVKSVVGGRKGWRLPSVHELASLMDPSVAAPGPTLPSGHPFNNIQSSFYWSATTVADNTTSTWMVYFGGGSDPVTGVNKTATLFFWCVRGGMNADQY